MVPLRSDSSDEHTAILTTVALPPLLVVFPGILRKRVRAYIMSCIVINLYFISGVLIAFSAKHLYVLLLGLYEALLSILFFTACSLCIRRDNQRRYSLLHENDAAITSHRLS